jgi:hypothetical protein
MTTVGARAVHWRGFIGVGSFDNGRYDQRFNVAMSRARDRMYLFRSLKQEDVKNNQDLKLSVMRHFDEFAAGQGGAGGGTAQTVAAGAAGDDDLLLAPFLLTVRARLVQLGYVVRSKVRVGRYYIDIVVEDAGAGAAVGTKAAVAGGRLAVSHLLFFTLLARGRPRCTGTRRATLY